MNVLWEDTGRWEGSSVGPNISDVTIEVEMKDAAASRRTALMPVMRHANFTDKTGDVEHRPDLVPVGNQAQGGRSRHVSLREFLAEPTRYMTLPHKGKIKRRHAAGEARPPRAGQRAGDVPARPRRRARRRSGR